MSQSSSIHFEISERKILLRIFDIVSVLGILYLVGTVFDFDYFKINKEHWFWSIVLGIYLTIFATIFELYDLQKASRFEIVVQNSILTASVTVLFYLLTPFFSPVLPDNRLQIVYFYISVNIALFLWRYAYIVLIATPRFNKRVLLIANKKQVGGIVASLHKSDPNYKVTGFINVGKNKKNYDLPEIEEFSLEDVSQLIAEKGISEIVIAASQTDEITLNLYNQLIALLEKGTPIREYTQVYEEITHRVPVQHVDKDFYRYFPFSRSNQNKLYLFFHRILDLLFSMIWTIVGLLISLLFLWETYWEIGALFSIPKPE
ncbi:MAG: hypothetical protein R2793_00870 [Flavobacteriaceae bacterium]